jgi:hypothetical protein
MGLIKEIANLRQQLQEGDARRGSKREEYRALAAEAGAKAINAAEAAGIVIRTEFDRRRIFETPFEPLQDGQKVAIRLVETLDFGNHFNTEAFKLITIMPNGQDFIFAEVPPPGRGPITYPELGIPGTAEWEAQDQATLQAFIVVQRAMEHRHTFA